MIFIGPTIPQRICNIYSPSLTTDGGVMYIPSGTQNVILYCICRINNVAVYPARWLINGTRVTRTKANGSSDPYYRNNPWLVVVPLIIPSFTANHVGTYGCGSAKITIDLAIILSGSYIAICNYNFIVILLYLICIYY